MGEGFTKLFASITASSIWSEDNETRIVWITMLAMADAKGYVGASVPGLADMSRLSIEETEKALAKFLAPDKYSRNKIQDGRRIEVAPRGWRLLNYEEFRNTRDDITRRIQNRDAQARKRDRDKGVSKSQQSQPESAQAEAEAEAEKKDTSTPSPQSAGANVRLVFDHWRKVHNHPSAKLDRKRKARISARFGEGYTTEHLCGVISNAKNDPFLMGENDSGKKYDGIHTLLRDAEQVDRLMACTEPGGKPPGAVDHEQHASTPRDRSRPELTTEPDNLPEPMSKVDTAGALESMQKAIRGKGARP